MAPKTRPFESHIDAYEEWFIRHPEVYAAELRAVKELMPKVGPCVEIGVGTGRFAEPLGIKWGVEPSPPMKAIAKSRGIRSLDGVAEALPLEDATFGTVLMVTTVCFLDNINQAFREAYRVLKNGGFLLIGLVDRNSPVGQQYVKHQHESVFYREATFLATEEVVEAMQKAGFGEFEFRQTIFSGLSETDANEPVNPGHGAGSFVVIRGRKPPEPDLSWSSPAEPP